MKKQAFWNIENVSSFRGFDVIDGEISLSDAEYSEYLDEVYGDIAICGMSYSAGVALKNIDPVAFRCGKSDDESEIQSELEDQLEKEDRSDIEFIDGDEDELEEDEE